jgi:hypothetical protein
MIIDEPLSAAPRKNITTEIKAMLYPPLLASPHSVRASVEIVATMIPRMNTGERIANISVERPIRMFPQIAPTPKRLKMLVEASLEKSRPSYK